MIFGDILVDKDGMIKGPFGSAVKKSLFVPKGDNTYKVYEQSVVANNDYSVGNYYLPKEYVPDGIEEGIMNQALIRVRLDEKVIYKPYFMYFFPWSVKKVATRINGDSVIPNLPPLDVLRKIEIDIPSLDEQKEIADRLSIIDEKIENNTAICSDLEGMAKLLYDYWFVQFDFPDENGKPYKSSGGKMVWNEDLKREIPEGWKAGSFGDVLSSLECGDRPSGGAELSGIPSIGAENIIGIGKYNFDSEKYVSNKYFISMTTGVVQNWDVLIYKDGAGVGQVSMFGDGFPYDKCAVNSHVFILRSQDNLYQDYLYLTLCQTYIKKIIIALAMKAAQPGLNQPAVKSIPLLIPSNDVLLAFNDKVDNLFHKIFNCGNESKQLASLRDFLLPMLMNGQVKIKNDEA